MRLAIYLYTALISTQPFNEAGFRTCFLRHSFSRHKFRSQSDQVQQVKAPGRRPCSEDTFSSHWLYRTKQVGRGIPASTCCWPIPVSSVQKFDSRGCSTGITIWRNSDNCLPVDRHRRITGNSIISGGGAFDLSAQHVDSKSMTRRWVRLCRLFSEEVS